MPRTKLDKHTVKTNEASKRAVKAAMARNGIFHDCELAKKLKTDAGYISKCYKSGFSDGMVTRMHRVLRFTEEELRILRGA